MKEAKNNPWFGLCLVTIILSLVLIVAFEVVLRVEPVEDRDKVVISEAMHIERKEDDDMVLLVGTIRNTTKRARTVILYIDIADKNGENVRTVQSGLINIPKDSMQQVKFEIEEVLVEYTNVKNVSCRVDGGTMFVMRADANTVSVGAAVFTAILIIACGGLAFILIKEKRENKCK